MTKYQPKNKREAASAPSLTLTVETVGEDVLIRFSGSRSDVVMVPAGFLPDFVKALQEILHEKQEVQSW